MVPALDRREVDELAARYPDDELEAVVPTNLDREVPHVDLAALVARHRARPFDAVVNRRERLVALSAAISSRLGLPTAIDEPLLARDKLRMSQAFRAAGVNAPTTNAFSAEVAAREVEAESYPCVVKPRFGLDSTCAVRVTDRARLVREIRRQRAVLRGLRRDGFWNDDFLVQPFIGGSEHTVDSLVSGSRVLLHLVSDKLATRSPYLQEVGNVTPSRLSHCEIRQLREAAGAAIAAVGIRNGWSHTEVKLWRGQVWVIEVAARMGGGAFECMNRRAYGLDMTSHLIDTMCGVGDIPEIRRQACVASSRLGLPGPAIVLGVAGLKDLCRHPWFEAMSGPRQRGAVMGPPWGWSNTVLEYVVSASSEEVASQRLSRARERLRLVAQRLPRWSHAACWKLSLLGREAGVGHRRAALTAHHADFESSASRGGGS